jgi:hypothetical protein
MNTCLAVFTCAKCSQALLRHWPFLLSQFADSNYIITTENTHCDIPEGATSISIGVDSYIDGAHLPERMVNTIARLLNNPWDALILAEYDTLIFNAIPVDHMKSGVASHLAGYIHSKLPFYHNPWVLNRETALQFIAEGRKVISEGHCQAGSHVASPDVFFGMVFERLEQSVQVNLWTEFSRNSLDREGDLERARKAYQDGVDIIHGVKTERELEYIIND